MEIANAKVTIKFDDPNELIEGMGGDEKVDFLQSLACHDEVIEYVMQQVFEGCTENGSHGSLSCSWNGGSPLQSFKAKLIDLGADEVAKRRIKMLERNAERQDAYIKKLVNEIHELRGFK